jgi:hypothetical protein
MAIILVNSTLGLYWCTDCGDEVRDIGHYCLPDEENDE